MGRRAVLLIIDGFGIGAMKDVPEVRPQDQGANTLLTVWDQYPELSLPSLASLGLWSAAGLKVPRGSHRLSGSSYGRCALAHEGADTYMGHQELMGTRPFPASRQLMRDVGPAVLAALHATGLDACYAPDLESAVLVEGQVVVADNMEADPGQNINVTGSLDFVSFERLVAIGKIVRSAVQVSRVIVVGGRGYDREGILHHVVRRGDQQGVDTPGLGVYDKNYMVRHLGLGVDVQQQVPTILNAAGFPVVLLGKAADVVECEGAALRPVVDSTQVTESALSFFDELDGGLIVVNYQESDLAGHEQDAGRYARVLKVIDEGVGEFLARLTEDDLLIVTGDHGNDPGIRHSRHTREYTPLLVYGRSLRGCQLGTRETLADVAATLSDFFGVKPPQFGRSFYGQLMP